MCKVCLEGILPPAGKEKSEEKILVEVSADSLRCIN